MSLSLFVESLEWWSCFLWSYWSYENCANQTFCSSYHRIFPKEDEGHPKTLRNQFASWLFLDGNVDHFVRTLPARVLLDDNELLLTIMFKLFCNWVQTKQLTSSDRVHCTNLSISPATSLDLPQPSVLASTLCRPGFQLKLDKGLWIHRCSRCICYSCWGMG